MSIRILTARRWPVVVGGLLLALALPVVANAQAPAPSNVLTNTSPRAAGDYWTPARILAATPYDLPVATGAGSPRLTPGPSQSRDGGVPATEPVAAASAAATLPAAVDGGAPRSKGSAGYPFTTSRVFPDVAVNTYPYRVVGKLFFTDNGAGFSCSASIIQRRILITAAHCIYNTAANRWHLNFQFIPAYNANLVTQPFGTWGWWQARVPTGWITGTESFPNSFDFGLIEIADQVRGATLQRIGNYLGWLGWQSFALVGNHVTQLGYPGNLDAGGRLIQNASQVANGGAAGLIGTAMWKGSSGGPWVQDFGVQAAGQFVTSTGPNRVVGVTSYGSSANPTPGPQYSGATILNNDFIGIYNAQCAHRVGNCTP